MSRLDDLSDLRDALDCIAHGALPTWSPPSTVIGRQAQHHARLLYSRYIAALYASATGAAAIERAAKADDEHRAHSEALTARLEAAEAHIASLIAKKPRRSCL